MSRLASPELTPPGPGIWAARARLAVLLVGSACFAVLLLTMTGEAAFIGLGLAGTFLVVPTVLGCFLVPSYKARLILGPLLFFVVYGSNSSGPPTDGPVNPSTILVLLSLMALAMAMPEVPSMQRFYARLFRSHS